MLIFTTEIIPGKSWEPIGLAKGSVVQSKHLGRDFMAGMKTIVGGEIKGYTEMMDEARKIATDRMAADATRQGADAIICMRYASSSLMQGAAEVMAYGTAVRFC